MPAKRLGWPLTAVPPSPATKVARGVRARKSALKAGFFGASCVVFGTAEVQQIRLAADDVALSEGLGPVVSQHLRQIARPMQHPEDEGRVRRGIVKHNVGKAPDHGEAERLVCDLGTRHADARMFAKESRKIGHRRAKTSCGALAILGNPARGVGHIDCCRP